MCTNLMIKAQKDTDTNKSKTSETSGLYLYAPLSDQPNLVSNSSYFPQVGLCYRSSWIACPGEALNLCAKFSKFLFLSVSSLSLSEIQTSKVACVALNRRKYLISILAQYLGESPDISGFCDVIDNQSEATKWAGYEMSNRHFSMY